MITRAHDAIPRLIPLLALGAASCQPVDDTLPYRRLSSYHLFAGPLAAQGPAAGVVPYDVNATLFADGAGKLRFLAVPAGGKIGFDATAPWTFPDGTMLVKTFFYDPDLRAPGVGRRLVETRILRLAAGAWTTEVYRWRDDQTEADELAAGDEVPERWLDGDGEPRSATYQVPATSVCKTCHGQSQQVVPLGPRTRQLDRDHDYGAGSVNQLAHLASLGLFAAPLPDLATLAPLEPPFGAGPLDRRARAWLDANCGHCHNPDGFASSTKLRLSADTTDPTDLGQCKHPVAAGPGSGGHEYDLVPGAPDDSIIPYRIGSSDPKAKMPPLPVTTVDTAGAALIHDWIASLTGSCR